MMHLRSKKNLNATKSIQTIQTVHFKIPIMKYSAVAVKYEFSYQNYTNVKKTCIYH